MRELPRNIDADLVLAVGHLLDDHAAMASVSLTDAIADIRRAVRRLASLTGTENPHLAVRAEARAAGSPITVALKIRCCAPRA